MTRQQFIARAIRAAERKIRVPPGWWGTWNDIYGPSGERVRYARGTGYVLRDRRGKKISVHSTGSAAIAKAKKL